MHFSLAVVVEVSLLLFLVALLYSSVGHGGASGYLAVLSFFSVAPALMSSTSLVLNVMVSLVAFWAFYRERHFSWTLAWPFLLTSIPAALVGGLIAVRPKGYFLLLAGALVFAAFRLILSLGRTGETVEPPPLYVGLPVGLGLGLLSGILGIGGGIFLSPLILLKKWGTAKTTAAVSALFILLNSMAGLGGRFIGGTFQLSGVLPFVLAAFLGGLCGSRLGANHFSGMTLRRILGAVLVLAAIKLVAANW